MAHIPWGELPVSDAHVHFFSHRFYSGLARQGGAENAEALAARLGWKIPLPEPEVLAQQWIEEMDRFGLRRMNLIASVHGDEESVARAVAAHPDRFFGSFMLDPVQEDAIERVRRAAAGSDLHCLCLFPAMHRYSLHDPRLIPVFDIAREHRLVVFVHCGSLRVGVRSKLGLPSPFDMRFSNPLDLHAIALRYPTVHFIVPHFGAGLLREALMLADLCPNICFDTSSSNSWMSYEGLDLPAVFRRCLNVMGPRRLLFGSDSSFFPRGWNGAVLAEQLQALAAAGVSTSDAEAILCTNLERMFAR